MHGILRALAIGLINELGMEIYDNETIDLIVEYFYLTQQLFESELDPYAGENYASKFWKYVQ